MAQELDQRVQALLDKGVRMPNPASVEVADDVDPGLVSGDGVVIHGGCRIRGSRTVISSGSVLGAEAPVTIENCQLGRGVELKGGYASDAVFLDGANLGLGHHVRGGTILEEEANGAHTVGLKQTILFPFVTLGSLINFCDALLAGGTSRSDHSEVGSSYIHFNFTPAGDKTTASLFGDVPRGVTLREHPIFLGGQGGAVGPVRVGYGVVVGAGSIVRSDLLDEDTLVVVGAAPDISRPFRPESYRRLGSLVAHNLDYLAHLAALEQWYRHARAPFFARQEFGQQLLDGALAQLAAGRKERVSRLTKLAAKLSADDPTHFAVQQAMPELCALPSGVDAAPRAGLVAALTAAAGAGNSYLDAVRGLSDQHISDATGWLQGIVDDLRARALDLVPALEFPAATHDAGQNPAHTPALNR